MDNIMTVRLHEVGKVSVSVKDAVVVEKDVPGVGVPPGGASGQVLTKLSGADYDTGWRAAIGGGENDHGKLTNRDAQDQHPIGAIAGLAEALAGKQPKGDYLTADKLQSATDAALTQAKASGAFDGAPGVPGEKGDKGDPGVPGKNGSDATVTVESITGALGYKPAAPSDIPVVPDAEISANTAARHLHANKAVLDGITGQVTADKVNAPDHTTDLVQYGAFQVGAQQIISQIPTVPTALKNPNALTIKIGSTTVTYDGSAAKTVEIADGSEVAY